MFPAHPTPKIISLFLALFRTSACWVNFFMLSSSYRWRRFLRYISWTARQFLFKNLHAVWKVIKMCHILSQGLEDVHINLLSMTSLQDSHQFLIAKKSNIPSSLRQKKHIGYLMKWCYGTYSFVVKRNKLKVNESARRMKNETLKIILYHNNIFLAKDRIV